MGGTKAVHVWVLVLLGLHLLMAMGAIGVFVRMAPAIETIIEQNLRSLRDGERMLVVLARGTQGEEPSPGQLTEFREALEDARANVTEAGEPTALDEIESGHERALAGDADAKARVVEAIEELSAINRRAMQRADDRARQLGEAGAWGIVFMGLGLFVVGLLILRSIRRNVMQPLEEIHAVLTAQREGDAYRRCSGAGLPRDVSRVYDEVNELLDRRPAS